MPVPSPSLSPDEYSGRTLGKYELICRLSAGGMSEIFLAYQKGLAGFRKLVVLKQVLPDVRGQEESIRLFLDEAKVSAQFNHPNIAQVYDLDISDGELFLVMEFVHGATLIEVAKACGEARQPIPVGFTLASARDVALALHYAHTFTDPAGSHRPIIHRDIAEKNIMVTYDGVTKLLDFGIAKQMGRSGRTAVGTVRGTSGYMSPEQILGEPVDPRSDVFSLGVVIHECLTGQRLFRGRTTEEELMAPLKAEVPKPSARVPDLPPALDAVVLKALERDRFRRFPSALELARAIEQAARALIWRPEQSGALVQKFFTERLEQTRSLLAYANRSDREVTSVTKVAERLAQQRAVPDNVRPLVGLEGGRDRQSEEKPKDALTAAPTSPQTPSARGFKDPAAVLPEAFEEDDEAPTQWVDDPLKDEHSAVTLPPEAQPGRRPVRGGPLKPEPRKVLERKSAEVLVQSPELDEALGRGRPGITITTPGTNRMRLLALEEARVAREEGRPPPEHLTVEELTPDLSVTPSAPRPGVLPREPGTDVEGPSASRESSSESSAPSFEGPTVAKEVAGDEEDDELRELRWLRLRRVLVLALAGLALAGAAAAVTLWLTG